ISGSLRKVWATTAPPWRTCGGRSSIRTRPSDPRAAPAPSHRVGEGDPGENGPTHDLGRRQGLLEGRERPWRPDRDESWPRQPAPSRHRQGRLVGARAHQRSGGEARGQEELGDHARLEHGQRVRGVRTLDPILLGSLWPLLAPVEEAADGPVWLTGGVVRDALLGRPVHDLDLVLPRGSGDVARRLADRLGGAFVPIGAAHGVARVVLPGSPGTVVDLADFRGPTLEADLAGRDVTVDALAVRVAARWGVVDVLFPEAMAMRQATQSLPHRFTVWEHSLRAVDAIDALLGDLGLLAPHASRVAGRLAEPLGSGLTRHEVLKLAVLLHDVAKPETRS